MEANIRGYESWIDNDVVDTSGQKVGKVTDVYYDDATHRPEWLAIKTGLFGSNDTFVPIAGSTMDADGRVVVAYDKDFIKDAPNIDTADKHMTPDDERRMWEYYGLDYSQRGQQSYGQRYDQRADKDFRYRRYDSTRQDWTEVEQDRGEVVSEATAVSEQVQKTQTPETVRLRKYQHTEMVPVTKEEIRVEKDVDTTTTTTTPSDTTVSSSRTTRRNA